MRTSSLLLIACSCSALLASACTTRTLTVTSEPEGALVWINDVQVGRTPVKTDFVYYGQYDVRVIKEGYEPIAQVCKAHTPLWDYMGPDLVAEALPVNLKSESTWHFDLTPVAEATQAKDVWETALIDRARGLRLDTALYEGPVPVENPAATPTDPSTDTPAAAQ